MPTNPATSTFVDIANIDYLQVIGPSITSSTPSYTIPTTPSYTIPIPSEMNIGWWCPTCSAYHAPTVLTCPRNSLPVYPFPYYPHYPVYPYLYYPYYTYVSNNTIDLSRAMSTNVGI